MFGRVDEVVKYIEGILRIFLKQNNYQVIPEKDFQLEDHSSKDTFPLEIHVQIKVSQDQPTIQIDPVEHETVDDVTNDQAVDNSSDATQDPLEIEIIVEELGKVGKTIDDGKEGEMDRNVKVEKEKGEEKPDKAPTTMIVTLVPDKGKKIVVEDDIYNGQVDLSTLSPLQALKLATLA